MTLYSYKNCLSLLTDNTLNGSKIIDSSIVATTKLSATGTKNSTTFLRGDNTWSTVSATGATSLNGLSDCYVDADNVMLPATKVSFTNANSHYNTFIGILTTGN